LRYAIYWVADKAFSLSVLVFCCAALVVVSALITIMFSPIGLGNIAPASFLMFYHGIYWALWGAIGAVLSFVVSLFTGLIR
jgi:hypothetical protein